MFKKAQFLKICLIFILICSGFDFKTAFASTGDEQRAIVFDSEKDMQSVGDELDLSLYNAFVSGSHTANSADLEGALAVMGSSFIPSGGHFNYGAFFDSNNGIGQQLTDRHRIALLIGGQVNAYGNDLTATVGAGITLTQDLLLPWVSQKSVRINAPGKVRTMSTEVKQQIFTSLLEQTNQIDNRLNNLVNERIQYKDGKYTVGEMSDWSNIKNYTVEQSKVNSRILVVNVPSDENGTAFLPQPVMKNDETIDQIIVTTDANKVVISSTPGSITNDKNTTMSNTGNSELVTFYLPNASQVTNFGTDKNQAPSIDYDQNGNIIDQTEPIKNDGIDPYTKVSAGASYSDILGSVIAIKATVLNFGGGINGYAFVKNLHQRNGAEVHNFYNPWLFEKDELGGLKVKKIDETTKVSLAGAEFLVKNSDKVDVGRIITDINGFGELNGLVSGMYTLQEIVAPEGYELDPTIHNVEVNTTEENKVAVIEITNKKTPILNKGKIELTKIDEESKEVLEGAKFLLKNNKNEEIAELISDKEGLAEATNLELGSYTLQETEAPEGYELDPTIHEIEITEATPEHLVKLELTNKLIPNVAIPIPMPIEPISPAKPMPLPIEPISPAKPMPLPIEPISPAKPMPLPIEPISPAQPLPLPIEPISPAQPLPLPVEPISPTSPMPLPVESIKGKLELKKIDEKTKEVLAGAEFSLKDQFDKEVATLISDEKGLAEATNLKLGSYTLQETKAPEGYELDSIVHKIEITEKNANGIIKLTIKNKKIKITPNENEKNDENNLLVNKTFPKTGEKTQLPVSFLGGILLLLIFISKIWQQKMHKK